MCHAKYSTWLYIYIFLININVNKRETLIKQIGYSQVSYKIYRKKYLPVGKTSQILPLSELFVFTITAFKIFSIFIIFVLIRGGSSADPANYVSYYTVSGFISDQKSNLSLGAVLAVIVW